MLVSGICQKILVERLEKFPEPKDQGYLSSFETLYKNAGSSLDKSYFSANIMIFSRKNYDNGLDMVRMVCCTTSKQRPSVPICSSLEAATNLTFMSFKNVASSILRCAHLRPVLRLSCVFLTDDPFDRAKRYKVKFI